METTQNLEYWVSFLKNNLKQKPYSSGEFEKELSAQQFSIWIKEFIEQVDQNVASKKSRGRISPSGLQSYSQFPFHGEALFMYSALGNHYGHGAASRYPYLSWHFVSIYYDIVTEKIKIGIEQDSLVASKIEPEILGKFHFEEFGDCNRRVVIYYEDQVGQIKQDTNILYEQFITICEKVLIEVSKQI